MARVARESKANEGAIRAKARHLVPDLADAGESSSNCFVVSIMVEYERENLGRYRCREGFVVGHNRFDPCSLLLYGFLR